jgi:hypothetical protein
VRDGLDAVIAFWQKWAEIWEQIHGDGLTTHFTGYWDRADAAEVPGPDRS